MASPDATAPGAGVVQKATLLLRHLAEHGSEGMRLKDLTESTGLPRPTVHRLLSDLAAERLIAQTAGKRYILGQQLFEFSLAAPNLVGDLERFRSTIRELAVELGDVVYLSIRRGASMHYLMREAGAYPIRTYTVQVGELRRISTSYSGLAMLASMPTAGANRIIAATGHGPDQTMRLIRLVGRLRQDMQRTGFVAGSDLVLDGFSGIAGVAVPVPNGDAAPFLAVSASAISQRLPPSRYQSVATALMESARLISDLIAEPPDHLPPPRAK